MEIFVFIHFFDDYHFSVGRRYNYLFGFTLEQTDGTAEEIHHEQVEYDTGYCYNIKRYFTLNSPIQGAVDSQQQDGTGNQYVCTFVVYADFFQFLYTVQIGHDTVSFIVQKYI